MNEEEMKKHVLDWLARLNEKFGNNLKKENLLKTGGYDKHAKNQNKLLDKNMTTTDSLNYATQEGTLR
jgi:hypothetical protein